VVDPTEADEVSVYDLEIGDCFDVADDADVIGTVIIRPCGRPHAYEMFHIVSLPAGQYPGPDTIEVSARALCGPVFERYVGTAWEDSDLDYSWIYPSAKAWIADDRTIQCFVQDTIGNPLTASVKDSKR
jgi:hypothetical protein